MTREGYNTAWLWKTWSRECHAAAICMSAGAYEQAERHLQEMQAVSKALDERERRDTGSPAVAEDLDPDGIPTIPLF